MQVPNKKQSRENSRRAVKSDLQINYNVDHIRNISNGSVLYNNDNNLSSAVSGRVLVISKSHFDCLFIGTLEWQIDDK
jgi:hypothetical protein